MIVKKRRNQYGSMAEAAGAMAMFYPTIIFSIFVILEATRGYAITRDLQLAAGLAARALATSGSTTTATQQDIILGNITVGKNVISSTQFYSVVWNKTINPPCVTVFVQYKSTAIGGPTLTPFPSPDPLHLGSLFIPKAQATYRLQS